MGEVKDKKGRKRERKINAPYVQQGLKIPKHDGHTHNLK